MSKDNGGPTSDRELLEMAAKAAGVGPVIRFEDGGLIIGPNRHSRYWNPLTDDGDAFRLSVVLRIQAQWAESRALAWAVGVHDPLSEPYTGCALFATRRAITRAAAAIGSAML